MTAKFNKIQILWALLFCVPLCAMQLPSKDPEAIFRAQAAVRTARKALTSQFDLEFIGLQSEMVNYILKYPDTVSRQLDFILVVHACTRKSVNALFYQTDCLLFSPAMLHLLRTQKIDLQEYKTKIAEIPYWGVTFVERLELKLAELEKRE